VSQLYGPDRGQETGEQTLAAAFAAGAMKWPQSGAVGRLSKRLDPELLEAVTVLAIPVILRISAIA